MSVIYGQQYSPNHGSQAFGNVEADSGLGSDNRWSQLILSFYKK